MPFNKRISNKYQFQISTNFKKKIRNFKLEIRNWKFSNGFSLIEILLSMFMLMAIVSIMLVVSGTYLHSRRTSLQTTAARIASRDIENQRKAEFDSISGGSISDSELSNLPSGTATRTVSNFGNPANPKIKQVTVTVNWTEKELAQEIKLDTLISKNGI